MSSLVSRNITVGGHRTSMRLEPEMWNALFEICRREGLTPHDVCTLVESRRHASSLTAALRVFIMDYFRIAATEDGHMRAGHGLGLLKEAETSTGSHVDPEGPSAASPKSAHLRLMP